MRARGSDGELLTCASIRFQPESIDLAPIRSTRLRSARSSFDVAEARPRGSIFVSRSDSRLTGRNGDSECSASQTVGVERRTCGAQRFEARTNRYLAQRTATLVRLEAFHEDRRLPDRLANEFDESSAKSTRPFKSPSRLGRLDRCGPTGSPFGRAHFALKWGAQFATARRAVPQVGWRRGPHLSNACLS